MLTCRPATTRSLPDGSLPELIRSIEAVADAALSRAPYRRHRVAQHLTNSAHAAALSVVSTLAAHSPERWRGLGRTIDEYLALARRVDAAA